MPNLFARKPLDSLLDEARETGEHSLKRTLGVFQLTALGVGAVIGAGIFVMAGLGAHYAGPGLMLSFVLSGLGCAFAGLCYAEFAAMIPLAGSAYTYAYATLGEIFAWIIGWDLTLEYAMGASTVSSGWSNHFIELLDIFHIKMPLWLAYDHWTALRTAQGTIARQMAQACRSVARAGNAGLPRQSLGDHRRRFARVDSNARTPCWVRRIVFGVEIGFNLPAFMIALVITAILAIGIRESARFNAVIVTIKVSVVLFVIGLGATYVNTMQLGLTTGPPSRRSACPESARALLTYFFAYIGFDAVSTTAQEAKNPQRDLAHRDHRVFADLHRAVYRGGGRADRHGAVARRQYRGAHRARLPRPRPDHRLARHHAGRAGRTHQRDAGDAPGPDPRALLHGQRRFAAQALLRGHPPQVPDSLEEHHPGGLAGGGRRAA